MMNQSNQAQQVCHTLRYDIIAMTKRENLEREKEEKKESAMRKRERRKLFERRR